MEEAFEARQPAASMTLSGRFEVRGQLGRGGMGIVYRALDRDRRSEVALKVLPRVDPESIARFKQEFRALTDVIHPNLVVLHELIATGEHVFFTMELVDGVDLVDWVCGAEPPDRRVRDGLDAMEGMQSGATSKDPTWHSNERRALVPHTVTLQEGRAPDEVPREPQTEQSPMGDRAAETVRLERHPTRADIARLREALGQLAAGISAIHEAGKLHLDLKPANVMVRRDGQVVVLDFGLARDLSFEGSHAPRERVIWGTPAYMAPEQALGGPLTQACDWYALGAILFRALTGELLPAKPYRPPPPPSRLVDGVPEDLDALCVALLARDPLERAGAAEVLRCAAVGETRDPVPAPATGGRRVPFVGREEQLASLERAFESTLGGRPVAAYVGGRSGMGKTALASQFVTRLSGRALVLSGRCYERESVPFKALDSVIDALAGHLSRLPRSTAAGLLPRGIHDLCRLFPVLRGVEAVADVPQRTFDVSDDGERRRRAFAALKELLSRLVDTGPLVLFIDDLQWGDLDSARLLAEVLGPPDPPALLLLGTYRTEEEASNGVLSELFRASALDVRKLEVPALSTLEASHLARALMNDEVAEPSTRASVVGLESEGSPFFVVELVRHLASSQATSAPATAFGAPSAAAAWPDGHMSLEQVLLGRYDRLNADARRLLEAIAVAGGPVEQGVAIRAAELAADPMTALATLRAGHLIRTLGTQESDAVETYHDRIRETVYRRLSPKRLAHCHLHLALELEACGRGDAEVLSAHFLAADRREEAGKYALAGAELAAEALAFDKAARLYRRTLDLGGGGPERRRELETRLGQALVNSGRGRDAALAFLSAATGAARDEAIALRHAAAEQFLISGHVDDGMDVLRGVLESVNLPLPGTPRRALVALLSRRARLAVRGLAFHERAVAELAPDKLRQIDICFSAALGLSVVDTIYGASFQALQLLLALRAGEPSRIALGLAFEAGHVGCSGGPARKRALELVAAAEALSDRLNEPAVQGFTRLMKGVAEWGVGRFATGLEHTTEAERIFRERCIGVSWQTDTAQVFSMICMTALGDFEQLSRRLPVWLKEARERGDLYATTSLRTFWGASTLLALSADQPERARADLDDAMQAWSSRGYHPQHYYALMSHTLVDLYSGDGAGAHRRITEGWPGLAGSLLLRVQGLAITALHLRGAAALAAADGMRRTDALCDAALRDASELTKTKVAWSVPLAQLIRAGVAVRRGDARGALALLDAAASGFDSAQMALHAAVARRTHGVLAGGDAGRDSVDAADRFLSSRKISRPDRYAAMIAPGFSRK